MIHIHTAPEGSTGRVRNYPSKEITTHEVEAFPVDANMYNRDQVIGSAIALTLFVLAVLVLVFFFLKAAEIV